MAAITWHGQFPYTTGTTQSTTSTVLNTTASNTWSYTIPEVKGEPIYDEFAVMVWEQRKAAGIEEPHPEPVGWKEPEYSFGFTGWKAANTASTTTNGQILWNGTIKFNA